jgi:transcription elongation GreA/GreB family factor
VYSLKGELLAKCREYVDSRIATSRQAMRNAQAAANEESKSSVGDKYETGRSMMQIEGENAGHQLTEAMKLKEVLDKIAPDVRSEKVVIGSLVITDKTKIFISIGIGKLSLKGEDILVVAPTSPLGKSVMGRSVNDEVAFNGELIIIRKIA